MQPEERCNTRISSVNVILGQSISIFKCWRRSVVGCIFSRQGMKLLYLDELYKATGKEVAVGVQNIRIFRR